MLSARLWIALDLSYKGHPSLPVSAPQIGVHEGALESVHERDSQNLKLPYMKFQFLESES